MYAASGSKSAYFVFGPILVFQFIVKPSDFYPVVEKKKRGGELIGESFLPGVELATIDFPPHYAAELQPTSARNLGRKIPPSFLLLASSNFLPPPLPPTPLPPPTGLLWPRGGGKGFFKDSSPFILRKLLWGGGRGKGTFIILLKPFPFSTSSLKV
jgi:hypothetical protein